MSDVKSAAIPDVLSIEFQDDPAEMYRQMRDEFPLIHHEPSGYYFISRYDDAKLALRDEKLYSTVHQKWQLEPVIGRSLGGMTGKEHATQRALIAPAFRQPVLGERFRPVIKANGEQLLKPLPESGTVDIADAFTKWFPINVIADMLGLPKGDHEKFRDWYSSFMAFLSNISQDPEVIAWGERTKNEFPEYILPIIRERRVNPSDDLVSVLATAEIDGEQMTDDQIRSFIGLLLIAGGETTDKGIASIIKNLMEHPDQLQAVRDDRSLIDAAFIETLRYTPPVSIVLRTSEVDVEIEGEGGGIIPAHSTVAVVVGAANRDDRKFADPETFNIFREDNSIERGFGGAADHLAFGSGRHYCAGSLLAQEEIRAAINMILDLMPNMQFVEGSLPKNEGLFTRAPNSLVVQY